MKKIVLITFIISILSLSFAYLKSKECANYNRLEQGKKQLEYIDNKIDENKSKLSEIEKEENNLKESNNEKVELLELWKNMLKEIKSSI